MTDSIITSKVGAPLLESFCLEGVNGYKTISARFERNVKIFSAENGAGKTTLLNALHALLTGNAKRLFVIDFRRLSIRFSDGAIIEIGRRELFPQFSLAGGGGFHSGHILGKLSGLGISDADFEEMLRAAVLGEDVYLGCTGHRKLQNSAPFEAGEIERAIREYTSSHVIWDEKWDDLTKKLKMALGDVSVLYLPTFRRIEAQSSEFQKIRAAPIADGKQGFDDWQPDRLLFLGMQDVVTRLGTVTSNIRRGTVEAYSRISARTLDQLLAENLSPAMLNFDEGEKAALKLVFARLDKSASPEEQRVMNLIETGAINDLAHQSLRSFLGQLLDVYKEQHDLEQAVESFVNAVDGYWNLLLAEKRFHFDKKTVDAQVVDTFTGKPLPLGALSSGEKQLVSIFARLYLDFGKRYLILIDEPELSLSMEWQQKFLPDIFAAPSCVQLIAATHSPFTFDNELDPYAGSLDISYSQKAMQ